MADVRGGVDLVNVGFSYASYEKPVLSGINLQINPGDFVAITGPSGAGKTTLMKVILGLYPATYGEVRIDGIPLSVWGTRNIRKNVGVVLQDDDLLSGTISENVSFFDDDVDITRVWDALRMAHVAEEVAAMPMRADTLVGDMGISFSGGQKQRILLARAFYRRPRMLLLDEATSHIDLARERAINAALADIHVTRIVIAHRPQTIAAADRVLTIAGGKLVNDRYRRKSIESGLPNGSHERPIVEEI